MSLRAIRKVVGLMPTGGHLSIVQDVPPAPSVIEASAANLATPASSPPPTVVV